MYKYLFQGLKKKENIFLSQKNITRQSVFPPTISMKCYFLKSEKKIIEFMMTSTKRISICVLPRGCKYTLPYKIKKLPLFFPGCIL